MPKFKAIWGPYKEEIQGQRIKWMFSCGLEDGSIRGYTLRFYYDSRKFSVRAHIGGASAEYARRMAEKDLFQLPQMRREELFEGRVTDLLKACLGDERIARATALAIQYRGR